MSAATTARAQVRKSGLLRRDPFQAFIGQLFQKTAFQVVSGLAVQHAGLRMAQIQALAGACDGHIHQTALFLQPVKVVHRVLMREQAFFQARDEHRIKLQALAGVHRHQLHSVFSGLRLVVARLQRSVGQKGRQRAHDHAVFAELINRAQVCVCRAAQTLAGRALPQA